MRSDLAYAQIPYEIPGRGFVDFHALRKTFGTRMATQEIDQATRQKLMRHSDPTLTDGTYLDATHLALAKKLQEMSALGAWLESRGKPG